MGHPRPPQEEKELVFPPKALTCFYYGTFIWGALALAGFLVYTYFKAPEVFTKTLWVVGILAVMYVLYLLLTKAFAWRINHYDDE